MNHKLLRMLNEAGFEFTPDIMAKLPAFENLVWLEREACAVIAFNAKTYLEAAQAIRARGRE
jgi:ABC-type sugar transport system substrate-binding protein